MKEILVLFGFNAELLFFINRDEMFLAVNFLVVPPLPPPLQLRDIPLG